MHTNHPPRTRNLDVSELDELLRELVDDTGAERVLLLPSRRGAGPIRGW